MKTTLYIGIIILKVTKVFLEKKKKKKKVFLQVSEDPAIKDGTFRDLQICLYTCVSIQIYTDIHSEACASKRSKKYEFLLWHGFHKDYLIKMGERERTRKPELNQI